MMRLARTTRFFWIGVFAGLSLLIAVAEAQAVTTTVDPGAEYTLTSDLMLDTADSFVAGGDATQPRCKIHGGGFGIATVDDPGGSTPWTGAVTIRNCDIDGLGTGVKFAVEARGNGTVTIQGSSLSMSGEIFLALTGSMSVLFQGNTIQADSVVPQIPESEEDSAPTFHAEGFSTGTKIISANTVLLGRIHLQSTGGWLIGGDTPADGNVLIGVRTGILLENTTDVTVRGNYSHTMTGFIDANNPWNQVKNLEIVEGSGILVEHNVFRGLNWVVNLATAQVELRYNLLFDAVERAWVLFSSNDGIKIHHNVLIAIKESQLSPAGGFVLENEGGDLTPDAEVYNNTLDGAGVCEPGLEEGAVVFHNSAVLGSLRSNLITGIRFGTDRGTALVLDYPTDPANPFPMRLLYTDYNLFYDPDSPVKKIYGAGVPNETIGVDPGFGLHDLPTGGLPDGSVMPIFANEVPRSFPFSEDDLLSRATTTCQVLAYYRQVYTPGPGSPVIDAGDPAEGSGNDIGAIGAGLPNALDGFGSGGFCDPQDIGHPTIVSDTYTCPPVPINTGSSPGVDTPTKLPSGIICVCEIGVGAGDPIGWLLPAAGIVLALTRRRSRPIR